MSEASDQDSTSSSAYEWMDGDAPIAAAGAAGADANTTGIIGEGWGCVAGSMSVKGRDMRPRSL